MRYPKVLLSCLSFLIIVQNAPSQTCTTSWSGNGDGTSWSDADNWDNGVPGAADNACIILNGTYTVIVGDLTVNSLTIGASSGTQTLQTIASTVNDMNIATTGIIGANGVLEWNNAILESGMLTNHGLVLIPSAGGGRVRGATTIFRNEATVEHSAGSFGVTVDGRVENASVWDVQGDVSYPGSGISGGGIFVNETGAIFRKTAGSGTAAFVSIGKSFDNFGTIDVQSGTLAIGWPSTHTDAVLTTSAGATLDFATDAAQPSAIFIGNNTGNQEGLLRIRHPFSAGANSVWNFTGNGLSWEANLTSGTLTNLGWVRIGIGSRAVEGASTIFRNEGTVEHVTGNLQIRGDGRVENAALWDVQNGNTFIQGIVGTGNTYVNESGAIFRKTAGSGLMRILGSGFSFDNFGTVDVQAGEVKFEIPSTHTDAVLTTSAGAKLRFSTGQPPATFTGFNTGNQAGDLVIEQNFIAGANAIWDFSGNALTWNSGLLIAGTLTNQTPVRITSSATKGADGATANFRTESPVVHEDGIFQVSGGARVENASLWDVQGDPDYNGATGAGTFVNQAGAVFQKTSGSGVTVFSSGNLVIENAGTVSVESGEIDINRPFDHQAGSLIQGTGIFDVTNSTFTHSGDTGPGLSPGILAWEGSYVMGSTASLLIEIADDSGDGTGHDMLTVTGNADVTQGMLNVTFAPDVCSGTPPCDYTILTYSGSFNGPFAQVNLPPNTMLIYPEDIEGIPGEVFIRIGESLPIELVSLKGEIEDEAIHLFWETASETDNAGFHVERKIVSKTLEALWEDIGWIKGQGNTVQRQYYEFTDSIIPFGVTDAHYRLRQIDFDGSYEYSPQITVKLSNPSLFILAENYPNPFNLETQIRFSLQRSSKVRLVVYDLYGSEVAQLIEDRLPAGLHVAGFLATDLPAGMYFYALEADNFKEARRMLLVR